jgi:hypothetical protein
MPLPKDTTQDGQRSVGESATEAGAEPFTAPRNCQPALQFDRFVEEVSGKWTSVEAFGWHRKTFLGDLRVVWGSLFPSFRRPWVPQPASL